MNLNQFFRSTKTRVLLCVLALLTGILLYSLKQGVRTDFLRRGMQTAVHPVRQFSAAISGNVRDKLDTYFEAKAYKEDNARLREQIAILNDKLIGYDDAVAERDALRDQLAIKEKHNDFVLSEPCKAILPVTNDIAGSFLIDQGEEDGITLNAPVLCSQGLIGVVTELSGHYATVTTLISPELSIGAAVLEADESGIIEGTLRFAAEGKTKLIYLSEDTKVKERDLVVTSSTTGLLPYGLPIGNVTEVGIEENGLASYAVIEPSVDLSQLNTVTVLLDFGGKGESADET